MYVSSLMLHNFRNYECQKISFEMGTNILCGDNAQGKTNILEAVYMFCRGKSIRAKQELELVRFGENFFRIEMCFHGNDRDFNGIISADRTGRKAIRINRIPITKLSMLMSYFNAVFFNPEDLELIKGSPNGRRRFIDSSLSQLYPNYLSTLISYNKALAQKSSLLRDMRRKGRHTDATLSVWNEALARDGARIMCFRRDFIDRMNIIASNIQNDISGESLKSIYCPGINISEYDADSYYSYLESHTVNEIEMGTTKYGIQRDDINIFVNDNVAKLFASQGQQRTAALAFKIAQGDYINSVKGEYPVLLLDDIMSELDINRRRYLWEKIKDKQVLITCTDTDAIEMPSSSRIFRIRQGIIED